MSDDFTGRKPKAAVSLDRLPPHSAEAEQGVLGCCLLAPQDAMNTCLEKFKGRAEVFYDLRHQTIFNHLAEMHEKQEPIDLITVRARLKDRGVLDGVGGFEYLDGLQNATPSAANLDYYIGMVLDKQLAREFLKIITQATPKLYESEETVEKVILEHESAVSALTERKVEQSERHLKEVLRSVVDDIEARGYHRGHQQLYGLPTGPEAWYLDKLLGGIAPDDYVVLAGRPGSGKTSLAVQVAEHLAVDYEWQKPTGKMLKDENGAEYPETKPARGVPVGIFSIEMTAESVGYRLLFKRAGIDLAQFRQGFAPSDWQQKLVAAQVQLAKANIYIDDSPAQSIGQIAAKARRMVKQHGIRLFILDYVQLVEMEGGNGFDRVKELTKISRKIMALKKQLKVPWIVCAQMNRNIETAEKERMPVLADLKDCGALEQDADMVVFTYKTPRATVTKRPKVKDEDGREYEGDSQEQQIKAVAKRENWKWSEMPYRVDIVVAKNRKGPTGHAETVFQNNLCAFHDWHVWKVKHGVEQMKQGERARGLGLPSNEEMDM